MDIKVFADNKQFWQRIKPLLSDKVSLKKNITLIENNNVISNNREVAEIMNNYFIEAVENLEIEQFALLEDVPISGDTNDENIDNIVKKYQLHPSVVIIKENVKLETKFEFADVTEDEIYNVIKDLDPKKASVENDIPAKILIGTNDIISNHLSRMFNDNKSSQTYPNPFKKADVTPIHKEKATTAKKNYRPVSLNMILSKVYEKSMYGQIFSYVEKFLSPYMFGYRKGHSTHYCLLNMIELWRKALDENKVAGGILTDLSKAFDCLSHELLIAKLEAYGFEKSALKFIYDYLKGRKQRTKVNDSYSSWRELKYGVPQGSILGPLLFNIFINDIFYYVEKAKIANYADDNTTHAIEDDILKLLATLEKETLTVLNWFELNEMKANDSKCHLIVANENKRKYTSKNLIYLQNAFLEDEDIVKLLGVYIDKDLSFGQHVNGLIKKGNQKLHALMRISRFLSADKLKLAMKTFIESQFNYCPLLWMCHNRTINGKINRLHERALRVVYKDNKLTFEELLDKDKSFTIHERNLQKLAIEMYKIKHNLSPSPVQELFRNQGKLNLRQNNEWVIPKVKTENYGKETIRYRGPLTWNLVPNELKNCKSLSTFKEKIKEWKPKGCKCRLCKVYIQDLGYI